MSLFIILSRHNFHLLIRIGFELLCNVYYWKFLLMVFLVSLHHQALISCGAKCYFFKTWISVAFSTVFLKKIESHKFSIFSSFFVPKMSHFFENDSIIKDNKKLSHILNKHFTDLTKTLKLRKASPPLWNKILKHLLKQLKKQSIKKIQNHFNSKEKFNFREF